MWSKTKGMAGGALVCCCLVVAGLLLQMVAGPVHWEMMAWPVNIIILSVMLLFMVLAYSFRRWVYVFRWMATLQAGVPAMVSCVMVTMLMGVTRQVPAGHAPADPIGITDMLTFWPFVLVYVWLVLLVGMVCLTRLFHPTRRSIPFLLNHLGLFLALVAGTLGNADLQRLRMIAQEGKMEWRAIDARHRVYELPIKIELHDFAIEEHPTLSYMSDVTVHTKNGARVRDTIRVNKPLSVSGWKIYQYSYDEAKGAMSDISVFELVRDPWLPYVYLGIFMMLAGAVWLFLQPSGVRNSRP